MIIIKKFQKRWDRMQIKHKAAILIWTKTRYLMFYLINFIVIFIINHSEIGVCQKRCWLLWARAHLKWTDVQWKHVLWSDESTFQIVYGNNGHCVLGPKKKRAIHIVTHCYQCKVLNPASVVGGGGGGKWWNHYPSGRAQDRQKQF